MAVTLDDGLILQTLREFSLEDHPKLASFYREAFREVAGEGAEQLYHWTSDLMAESHPTTSLDDLFMVVDPNHDYKIVSAVLLIPQLWRYEDVNIPVGRVELVATDPEYRRRGLVRLQMDVVHERSARLGHIMQSITGIPHYYRRFGYAFTVPLGSGMGLNFSAVPALNPDQEASFTLRAATNADIPSLIEWDRLYADQCLLSTVRSEAMWHYELNERSENTPPYMHTYIIMDQHSEAVGYVAYVISARFNFASIVSYNVGEKSSILATFFDVLRAIDKQIKEQFEGTDKFFTRIGFDIGSHPTIETLLQHMSSGVVSKTPYAWYMRIPDLPLFIQTIKPVLERRLQGSGANNYTGELKISFFDFTGLLMQFEDGKLVDIQHQQIASNEAQAQFPYHSFLNLVLGHHQLDELRYILPEVNASPTAGILLGILFPEKAFLVDGARLMFDTTQSPQEQFRLILLTVMGQVFQAAGYDLEESPVQWAGGRFQFYKALDDDLLAFIEYQLLAYVDSEWSSGMPSRFKVTLTRSDQNLPTTVSQHPKFARRDLSALVVEDFSVAILPSADHWWAYRSVDELGKALAESGHLLVGYGLPWLSGELNPGGNQP